MKEQGIIDRFEGDLIVVEIGNRLVNIPKANAPQLVCEGMVVIVEEDRILSIDKDETQRREDHMRQRFERILGKHDDPQD